jgi:Flp pilus assembly pilin Flp
VNEIVVTGFVEVQNVLARLRARATRAEQGQGLVEYVLILAFIAIAVIVALKLLQPAVDGTFDKVANCLTTSGAPVPAGPTPAPCS